MDFKKINELAEHYDLQTVIIFLGLLLMVKSIFDAICLKSVFQYVISLITNSVFGNFYMNIQLINYWQMLGVSLIFNLFVFALCLGYMVYLNPNKIKDNIIMLIFVLYFLIQVTVIGTFLTLIWAPFYTFVGLVLLAIYFSTMDKIYNTIKPDMKYRKWIIPLFNSFSTIIPLFLAWRMIV
ncbi:hypothetical protein [Thermoanaerobacterium thermosaccharolyticum]|uniref:hypothetical protein n=1 Tax=Thermoanaerobacterium thermosaccharolyticum TaxID=1517 RepID=UPI0017857EF4|nr:hypothetical protein [Thermoanaerobacterium thermosaccharolyticum]MBE0069852.1 hypothetical protein [Thermoanaerobacterium thermosaccharolyticum]MBE0227483.1 hypothetical protein [Thermoanaerobacterium thermosaccharolyticum]